MKTKNLSSPDRKGTSLQSDRPGRSHLSSQVTAIAVLILMSSFGFTVAKQEVRAPANYPDQERTSRLTVASNTAWTDTGYDVRQGEEIRFHATGGVSLQLGNPMAYCGPDGYDLKTLQQPLSDNNIGALIGKVVLLISIEIDEETKEEKRNELVELFYIGSNQRIVMPIDGRLYLGMNENLVEDNSGQYTVEWQLVQKGTESGFDESRIRPFVF